MSLHPRSVSLGISERVYRWLLMLYPSAFRHEFGPPLVQAFRDGYRDAHRQDGKIGEARLWLAAIEDLVSNAFAEWVLEVLPVLTFNRAPQSPVLYTIIFVVGAIWGLLNHFLDDLLYVIPAVGPFLASDAKFTALAVFAFWLILALAVIWLNTRLRGSTCMAGVTCAMLWGSAFFFFLLYDMYYDWPRIVATGGSVQTVGGFVPAWVAYLVMWLTYSALFSFGGFAVGWFTTYLRGRFLNAVA